MEILISIAVGAIVGGLAGAVRKSTNFCLTTSVAVGILGGLLGLASGFWLGDGGLKNLAFSAGVASGVGAAVTLLLWIIAQRLFFGNPPEPLVVD